MISDLQQAISDAQQAAIVAVTVEPHPFWYGLVSMHAMVSLPSAVPLSTGGYV